VGRGGRGGGRGGAAHPPSGSGAPQPPPPSHPPWALTPEAVKEELWRGRFARRKDYVVWNVFSIEIVPHFSLSLS
jgi:hypothetical protein